MDFAVVASQIVPVAAWAVGGYAAAHVLESVWHRFIAHGKRPDPTRTGHLEHHRLAAERVEVAREVKDNALRTLAAIAVVAVVVGALAGVGAAAGLAVGLAAGFVAVNLLHARMHARAPRGRWEEWMWRFHWHHHAVDARVNFGLTNPLLDFVLGTAVAPASVDLPPKLVPAWLRDAGGDVAGIRVTRP